MLRLEAVALRSDQVQETGCTAMSLTEEKIHNSSKLSRCCCDPDVEAATNQAAILWVKGMH